MATIDDPVAKRTRWGPASGGGANFQEHTLVQVAPNRLEFRMALGAGVFYYALITVGVGCLGIALYFFMTGARSEGWFFVMVSFLPCLIGGLGSYFTSRPRVFDLETGWYWKGRKPLDAADIEQRNNCTSLNNVYALQILRETVRTSSSGTGSDRSSGSSFDSYELNLVLYDASRINVVDHGNIDAIRSEASQLGRFLGVPIWDVTLSMASDPNEKSESSDAPYAVDKRPMPGGEDLEQLLPERVGSFQRDRIRAGKDLYRDPIYVEYTAGQHAVEMELGVCRTPDDAQQGVRTYIAESADVCIATEAVSVGTEPSFHKGKFDNPRMGERGKRLGVAWSRGRYYFSAGARTGDILDTFMTAFPY